MQIDWKNLPIPAFLKNFYSLVTILFFIWMLLFDTHDIFTQIKNNRKLGKLEQERRYYQEKIEEVTRHREELMGNTRQLEKFAREHYLMKKPTEDVYIVEDEQEWRDKLR